MSYELYPSDLTNREWEYIKRLIPAAMRLTINAIFYINRTGCQWRHLPREYPPWQTVYGYFRTWRITGVWERIHDRLRDLVREQEGRERQPTAAILDSQRVKTTVSFLELGLAFVSNSQARLPQAHATAAFPQEKRIEAASQTTNQSRQSAFESRALPQRFSP